MSCKCRRARRNGRSSSIWVNDMTIQKEDSEYWLGSLSEEDVAILVEALSYYKLALSASCRVADSEYAERERKRMGKAEGIRKALLEPFAKGEIKK